MSTFEVLDLIFWFKLVFLRESLKLQRRDSNPGFEPEGEFILFGFGGTLTAWSPHPAQKKWILCYLLIPSNITAIFRQFLTFISERASSKIRIFVADTKKHLGHFLINKTFDFFSVFEHGRVFRVVDYFFGVQRGDRET